MKLFNILLGLLLISFCFASSKHSLKGLKGKHQNRLPVKDRNKYEDVDLNLNENYWQPEQIHISYGC